MLTPRRFSLLMDLLGEEPPPSAACRHSREAGANRQGGVRLRLSPAICALYAATSTANPGQGAGTGPQLPCDCPAAAPHHGG